MTNNDPTSMLEGVRALLDGCSLDDSSLPREDIVGRLEAILRQHTEAWRRAKDAAREYYTLLRQGSDAPPAELVRIKARLDELLEPFLNNAAFVAWCQMQRAASRIDDLDPAPCASPEELEFGGFRREPNGSLTLTAEAPEGSVVFAVMAKSFGQMLSNVGAMNYIELRLVDPDAGRLVATIQRSGRITPHEARLRAEAEVRRLRALCVTNDVEPGPELAFAPDPPEPLGWTAKSSEMAWITLDVAEQPNVLRCSGCGASARLPEKMAGTLLVGALKAFEQRHADCSPTAAAATPTPARASAPVSPADDVPIQLPEELLAMQRDGRAKAAEKNTGLPCDVCGSKQQRFGLSRHPDGTVVVQISYAIPAEKAWEELRALRHFLEQFQEQSPRPPRAKHKRSIR